MKYKKLSKKEIHINLLKCAITNINCRQSNLLNIIHFINKLSNSYVHRIDIRINFMMINKDFRLL